MVGGSNPGVPISHLRRSLAHRDAYGDLSKREAVTMQEGWEGRQWTSLVRKGGTKRHSKKEKDGTGRKEEGDASPLPTSLSMAESRSSGH